MKQRVSKKEVKVVKVILNKSKINKSQVKPFKKNKTVSKNTTKKHYKKLIPVKS